MESWTDRQKHAAAMNAVERRIAAAPDDVAARFDRACLLTAAGRVEEAKAEYIRLLALAPRHAGAMNNMGAILVAEGRQRAARVVYGEVVRLYPDDPMGRVNLANMMLALGEGAAARPHYEAALAVDPQHREAHRGLAQLLQAEGDEAGAEGHWALAYRGRPFTVLPQQWVGRLLPLLVLVSARDGNLAYETLIGAEFGVTVMVAEFDEPGLALPPHALVLNAIGEADLCRAALDGAARVVARSRAPVINRPEAVRVTGRSGNAERLGGLEGVRVPLIRELPRDAVTAERLAATGFRFPLLLRAPGFHMGRHFVEVASPDALAPALAQLPGERVMAIEYLDARGADGKARKFRVMFVDGQLYPLHLAIADQWKIHYFSADMADQPEHRAEEAAFLADLPGFIGAKAVRALERIRDALALDYGGVDFGLSRDGEILLFEANATMIAALPPPDPIWDYRRAPAEAVRAAAKRMLRRRAGQI